MPRAWPAWSRTRRIWASPASTWAAAPPRIAVFQGGHLVHTDTIPVGGVHVTNDIARGLSTPLTHAERMKTLYGSAMPSPVRRPRDPQGAAGRRGRGRRRQPGAAFDAGADHPAAPRRDLRDWCAASSRPRGFDKLAGRRVVLTGGAAADAGRARAGGTGSRQASAPRPARGISRTARSDRRARPSRPAPGLLRYARACIRRRRRPGAPHGRQTHAGNGPFGRLGALAAKELLESRLEHAIQRFKSSVGGCVR